MFTPIGDRTGSALIRRRGRVIWALLAYMLACTGIIAVVSSYYLIPALKAYNGADQGEKKVLEAHAMLVMSLVLVVLAILLLLTFRISRFFFPRPLEIPTKTKYIDVWAESGRRLQTPPPETEEDSNP